MNLRIDNNPLRATPECTAVRRTKAASEITVLRPDASGNLVKVGVIPPPADWYESRAPKMTGVPQEPNQRKALASRKDLIHADVENKKAKNAPHERAAEGCPLDAVVGRHPTEEAK